MEPIEPICLQFACAVFAYIVSPLAPAAHTLPPGFQSPADTLNSSVTWLFGLFLVPDSARYQLHKLYSQERGTFYPVATVWCVHIMQSTYLTRVLNCLLHTCHSVMKWMHIILTAFSDKSQYFQCTPLADYGHKSRPSLCQFARYQSYYTISTYWYLSQEILIWVANI